MSVSTTLTLTPTFEERLREFLNEATRGFRNGPNTTIYQNRDGSTDVIYEKDTWKAVNHCSCNKLDSTVKVYLDGALVFVLGCAHSFFDPSYRYTIFNCLHSALLDPDPRFPIRGSNDSESSERCMVCYHNRSHGFSAHDLSEFAGSESITIPGADGHLSCIYAAQYSGGIIRANC